MTAIGDGECAVAIEANVETVEIVPQRPGAIDGCAALRGSSVTDIGEGTVGIHVATIGDVENAIAALLAPDVEEAIASPS
jgi:predicted naringenin-chalcone synthase